MKSSFKQLYTVLNSEIGIPWTIFVLFVYSLFAFLLVFAGVRFIRRIPDIKVKNQGFSILSVFFLSVTIQLFNGVAFGIPLPHVSDEFSYLFGADTFAHFRLTNPVPPSWKHFETYHVLLDPVFVSKYPPLVAMALAVGQILTGYPIVGAWLGLALACVSVTWALSRYLGLPWAMLGGGLLALHPLVTYWGRTYWGGQLAVIGGALVLGALAPLLRRDEPLSRQLLRASGLQFGGGLFLLAGTRPFEGAILAMTMVVLAIAVLFRRRELGGILSLLQGLALPLLVLIAWTGIYNRAVTGSFLEMPYQRQVRIYESIPLFTWQKLPPFPQYNHVDIQANFQELRDSKLRRDASPSLRRTYVLSQLIRASLLLVFAPALAVGFVLGLVTRDRDWHWRLCLAIAATCVLVGAVQSNYMSPHYTAPAVALNLLVSLWGWKAWSERRQKAEGRVFLGLLLYTIVLFMGDLTLRWLEERQHPNDFVEQRLAIQKKIEQVPGGGIVFVRYYPGHMFDQEWVYNEANWQQAKVLWVRDCSLPENRELMRHFPGKKSFLVHALANGTSRLEEYVLN